MAPLKNTATILAIGTELTTGQITNRNAAWISEQLAQLGIEVCAHETVPDDRALIQSALDHCASLSHLIFVTGGLGPTSDDFTREEIAKWAQQEMEFHEPSWQHIETRLGRFGIPIAQSNRQQCFFPKGSRVIFNPEGTANAFTLSAGETKIWVLPGPPREVEAVWKEIAIQLRAEVPEAKPLALLTWQCLGKSEAELGEITERVMEGSGLQTGYRAHRPIVEVKIWCPESQFKEKQPYFDRLDQAIAPWTITRQGEDLALILMKLLHGYEEIEILDACTGGIIIDRLGPALRDPHAKELSSRINSATEWETVSDPLSWMNRALSEADEGVLTLAVAGLSASGEFAVGLRNHSQIHSQILKNPFTRPELADRAFRMSAELTLKTWIEFLKLAQN